MEIMALIELERRLPRDRFERLVRMLQQIAPELQSHRGPEGLARRLALNGRFVQWVERASTSLADVPFERFLKNLGVEVMVRSHETRQRFASSHGYYGPAMISMEPGSGGSLMDVTLARRVLGEARDLGAGIVSVVGEDPLASPWLVDVSSEHPDTTVVVHTRPDLVDGVVASRLAACGNLWPAVMVDPADEKASDGAMARLREAGVLFGVSVTAKSDVAGALAADDFADRQIDRGAMFLWVEPHVPVDGGDPAVMATADERDGLRRALRRWQRTRPLLVIDPCLDGSCLGGCLAASRTLHVQHDGVVTPCPHIRFGERGSLLSALGSRLFAEVRRVQPCDENLLRLCPVTDHPDILRDIVDRCEPDASVTGAHAMLRDRIVTRHLDAYSQRWADLAHAAWNGEDYRSGSSVMMPFVGPVDVHESFPSRMQHAHLVAEIRRAMGLGYDPQTRKKRVSLLYL